MKRAFLRTATGWIAVLTIGAWLLVAVSGLQPQAAVAGGFIPARMTEGASDVGMLPALLTPLSATLLHADVLHLGFNMMMLFVCGVPLERAIGVRSLIILYLTGAFAASTAQWTGNPSLQAPMVGASGAVSALVGGYAMLFGRSRVRLADPALARAVHVIWLAASWIGIQLLIGLATRNDAGPSIAVLAHIGGLLAGIVLITPLYRLHWRKA